VGFLLSQLGWNQARLFRAMLEPFGLEPREFATLRALAGADGQSQQAVCSATGIPPSRMVALVDSLEAKGLVERRLNLSDRRTHAIHVTDVGRDLLARTGQKAGEGERWLCEVLSSEERDALLDMLMRIADHVDLPADIHPDMTQARPMAWPGSPDDEPAGHSEK
jgi:DNA-binding MarR family transcriptional regulator